MLLVLRVALLYHRIIHLSEEHEELRFIIFRNLYIEGT